MKPGTDGAIQHHDGSDDDVPQRDGCKCLPPRSFFFASGCSYGAGYRNPYQDSPTASIDDARAHVAALVASEIQYVM